jgi:hypothetical protein
MVSFIAEEAWRGGMAEAGTAGPSVTSPVTSEALTLMLDEVCLVMHQSRYAEMKPWMPVPSPLLTSWDASLLGVEVIVDHPGG